MLIIAPGVVDPKALSADVFQRAVQMALDVARLSPCAKSHRGVVAVDRQSGQLLAAATNGPPAPMACTGSPECRAACPRVAVHAEQRALLIALEHHHLPPGRVDIIHVKADLQTGELVAGGGPSCVECSKLMLDAGIGRVYLHEEVAPSLLVPSGGVWIAYECEDFHRRTLRALGLPADERGERVP